MSLGKRSASAAALPSFRLRDKALPRAGGDDANAGGGEAAAAAAATASGAGGAPARQRTFAHADGDWASFVSVELAAPARAVAAAVQWLDRRLTLVAVAAAGGGAEAVGGASDDPPVERVAAPLGVPASVPLAAAAEPVDAPHVSLSRTHALREHEIEPLAAALRRELAGARAFSLSLAPPLRVLASENGSRAFAALPVRRGRASVMALIGRVDAAVAAFGLERYHGDPVPHASLSWAAVDPCVWRSAAGPDGQQQRVLGRDLDAEAEADELEHGHGVPEFEAHVRAVVLRAGNKSISLALAPQE
jgi:hypothetical protein